MSRMGYGVNVRGAAQVETTHIFKLPLGLVGGRRADFSTSVGHEWLCLRLLAAYGLPTARADIASFGKQRVLVVERFDRTVSRDGTRLLRLVQEDFCQATGTSPLVKYENEGDPGPAQLFTLAQQSVAAEQDLRTLMAAQVVFWLLRDPTGMPRTSASSCWRARRAASAWRRCTDMTPIAVEPNRPDRQSAPAAQPSFAAAQPPEFESKTRGAADQAPSYSAASNPTHWSRP